MFIGATNDSRFRAFDKDTGKELWTTRLPASAHANPMTFLGSKTGKQYRSYRGGRQATNTMQRTLMRSSLLRSRRKANVKTAHW